MKLASVLTLVLLLTASRSLQADNVDVVNLTTVSGLTYRHCQIMKVYPDGVAFRHDRGIAKLLYTDLTPEWRKHFGYDPDKVKAYERKVKEDKAKAREVAEARATELRKAQAEAYSRALEAQALIALQAMFRPQPAGGNGYDYGYTNFVGTSPFGQLSTRDYRGALCNVVRRGCATGPINNGCTTPSFVLGRASNAGQCRTTTWPGSFGTTNHSFGQTSGSSH